MNTRTAQKLKELVKAHGGVAKVCVDSGVSLSTLQKLMAGRYPAFPKIELRERLAVTLGVSVEDLFPREDARRAS